MGEVYRATDTRLDRTVAIKVLASHLSSSPELKQRMEREARAISSLNHPHICQLYDIGSHNGSDFLVMEFLQGETLAERLRRGALPLNEIYKIGIAVGEALSLAHRQGIVHRDLKPGNIMLTQAGAKLMDFGLAKPVALAASGTGSGAPPSFTAAATMSGPSPLSPLTTAGTIVGTIQYMSPEQIEGKEADARSDIFALGAVLYEMAAGKRPFEGKSQLSLASSILEKDPEPVRAVKPQTPAAFEHVIATCLQKNPEHRFQSVQDVKVELQWIAAEKPEVAPAAAPAASNRSERLAWAAGVIAALLLGAAGNSLLRPSPPARTMRTFINPPEKMTLNLAGDFAGPPTLSPDGSNLVFSARSADNKSILWIRPMGVSEARALPGTDNAIFPFWSPDGRSLGFFADTKLKTIELNGGGAQVIADAEFGRGGAWGRDGQIMFAAGTQTGISRVSASGGGLVPVTKLDATLHTSHRWPFFLPDGKHFLYLGMNHDPSKSGNDAIYYASVDGKENRLLFACQSNAIYADGYLLFARGDQLVAQPFDPVAGKLSGEAQSVAKGVVNDTSTWHMDASASEDGVLTFGTGGASDWQLLWVDRSGKEIGTVVDKLPNLITAKISPQGDRIALQMDAAGVSDIWVLDLARGVKTRITFGPVGNTAPVWSPDGKWIAYNSGRSGVSGLFRKPSDGSGAEELLISDGSQALVPADWSRDGKFLFYQRGIGSKWDVWALPLEGEWKPQRVQAQGAQAHLSPDGRWLAYTSTETPGGEVYVVPFGAGQGRWQVSTNGGSLPQWSKDGKSLYYLDQSFSLFAVPVKELAGALQLGSAERLIGNWVAPDVFYDIPPDGKKVLMDRVSQQVNQSITVVTNFTMALKK